MNMIRKNCVKSNICVFINVAVCKSNSLKYAVKRIQLPHDSSYKEKVLKEKEVMQKLDHKNIIKCTYVAFQIKNDEG